MRARILSLLSIIGLAGVVAFVAGALSSARAQDPCVCDCPPCPQPVVMVGAAPPAPAAVEVDPRVQRALEAIERAERAEPKQ
jgi:hypothetical protein